MYRLCIRVCQQQAGAVQSLFMQWEQSRDEGAMCTIKLTVGRFVTICTQETVVFPKTHLYLKPTSLVMHSLQKGLS